jgi:hypothetical protein
MIPGMECKPRAYLFFPTNKHYASFEAMKAANPFYFPDDTDILREQVYKVVDITKDQAIELGIKVKDFD